MNLGDQLQMLKSIILGLFLALATTSIQAAGPQKGSRWTDSATGMEFVGVPAGCFKMGSNHEDNEQPIHKVCVDGFWLGKYEVTQGQWQKVMGTNPSSFKKQGKCTSSNCPVEKVSWEDAQEFAEILSEKTGQEFSLPTEAEWEYACQFGKRKKLYSGSNSAKRVGWTKSNSGKRTHGVGQKKANALGLYDMTGNVWEWVEDGYGGDAYSKHEQKNPIYDGGQDRVWRGGSWFYEASYARCASRNFNSPSDSYGILGFRLSRTP
jgi:formylglycine-generating enzyme required for sulfatase activity